MVDVHSAVVRSRNMAAIRATNTQPELRLRRALFAKGFRYRLHERRLPGRPDLVLPKYNAVILVHGCFFHGHACSAFRWPATRKTFWREKIAANRRRDRATVTALRNAGWRVLTVWECALRGRGRRPMDEITQSVSVWIKQGSSAKTIVGEKYL
jgi:DNA mismatch endonuclease, patch repair protein